jgi:antitoxin PrlF
MKEVVSTITSKGQVTVPAEVRRHLGVSTRDKLAFVIDDDGSVHVRAIKYPTVASLQGAAGSLPRPLSWREMREIAYDDRLATQLGSGE